MLKTLTFTNVYILVLCVAFTVVNAQTTPPRNDNFDTAYEQFKTLYEKEFKSSAVFGSSFMFIRDNKVVGKDFYGMANREKNQAVDEETIYHWASITKVFTGIAIMQLRDHGKLKLDDPVVKYIPELRQVYDPFGDISEITIRHLLSHTGGFRSQTFPWKDQFKEWQPHEPQEWSQIVAMLPFTEVEFKPGSKFQYSNLGIVFLGRIIELITKDDYEVYIDKNILRPLEMSRSYFDATPYHLLKYRSHSYFIIDGKLMPGRFDVDTGITVSNGGLNAPLGDIVKFLNFLVGNPQMQPVYEGILRRSTLEEMWQPGAETFRDTANSNNYSNIGLTFFIDRRNGLDYISHSGDQNGFVMFIETRPKQRAASILAFNTNVVSTTGTPPPTNPVRAIRAALRKLYESFADKDK